MRRLLQLALLLVGGCLWARQTQAQAFDLALLVGQETGLADRVTVNDLAVDAAGNSYVTGSFIGTIKMGATTLAAPSAYATSAAFVAKIDANGKFLWAVQSTLGAAGYSIVLDAAGNAYVAGTFEKATFGGIVLPNAGTAPGSTDVFVARLDAGGHWQWAVGAGGSGLDIPSDLALSPTGNLYLTGAYTAAATFGTVLLPNPTASRAEAFVASLDTRGAWRWAVRAGGPLDDMAATVALDASGRIYVAGVTSSATSAFGSLSITGPIAYVAQLDDTGAWQWVMPCGNDRTGFIGSNGSAGGFGSLGYGDHSLDLASDQAGNLYLAGRFEGPTALFGTVVLANATPLTYNGFVARFDNKGAFRWAVPVGGPGNEVCSKLTIDARNNIYVTGSYTSPTVVFGATVLRSPNSNNHVYLASLDALGTWRWALAATTTSMGITSSNASNGLALGPGDAVLIGGSFLNAISFGPGLNLQGSFEGFLARALPPPTVVISGDTLLCNGGQLQLRAITYGTGTVSAYRWSTGATTATINITQPGTYSVTVTFAGGATQTATYRVQEFAPVVGITGGLARLCPGGTVQLRATALGAKGLRWNTGDSTASLAVSRPGTYTVTASYGAGCVASAQVMVVANGVIISGRQQLCPGQSTTLTAAGAGGPVASYRWNTGATTPTLRVAVAGSYSVTATFADGCVATAVHLLGPPKAKVASVSGDTLLCPAGSLALTATNPDALSYRWNTGATTPMIAVTAPGTYAVELTYEGGCTSRDSLRVLPVPVIPAFALGPDTTLCLEVPLVLRAPVMGGPGVVRRWSDGSTGPTLQVTEPGLYSLQVTTPCETHTAARRVAYASCLVIPNVITPNNDGHNDQFVITGLTHGAWSLAIYNRWGRQVYATPSYQHDWGMGAAPGVYYYLLSQGATHHKGFLEVIR